MKLSDNQRAHLARLGFAVDEMETRCEAKRRVIEATREALRRQREKIARLADSLEDWHHRGREMAGSESAAESGAAMRADKGAAERQAQLLELQIQDTEAELQTLIAYFSPLRSLFEAILARSDETAADLGVPRGEVVPRSVRADVVIGGRATFPARATGGAA